MNKQDDIQTAIEPVITAFSQMHIPYYISGSVASSTYGFARATLDVDIVAQMQNAHVDLFVKSIHNNYYCNEETIRTAVTHNTSFNLIHLDTLFKIDIFIVKNTPYNMQALQRKKKDILDNEHGAIPVYLASCEDIILNKLDWFHKGGEVSERQWLDVIGIIKVQQKNIDKEYLYHWAKHLELQQLLENALNEAST